MILFCTELKMMFIWCYSESRFDSWRGQEYFSETGKHMYICTKLRKVLKKNFKKKKKNFELMKVILSC